MSAPGIAVAPEGRRELRLIPALEKNPQLVALAQTPPGKLLLLAVFSVVLAVLQPSWLRVTPFLVLTSFFPRHRRAVVSLGTGVLALALPNLRGFDPRQTGATLVVFSFAAVLCTGVRSASGKRRLNRPVSLLICVVLAYSAIIGWRPGLFAEDSFAWRVAEALATYQWFIGFALLDRLSTSADPTPLQVGRFMPFWGSTVTPFPKGAANLRKIEAHDGESLAITQLKGVKLVLWCLVLAALYQLFRSVVYEHLGVLEMSSALQRIADGQSPGWRACWASVLCNFADQLFFLTVLGHRIIACCRMAGFSALRNTYRPFESRTVAEFWNRYYYYFKELLVDFFYYPAFIRYFKKHPWLRRNFAVFAAVFFGDMYYHFARTPELVRDHGFQRALGMMSIYGVQCAMLAVAICISQSRSRGRSEGKGPVARWLAVTRVVAFYCFMFAFVDESFRFSLGVHLKFFGALLGLPVT